MIGIDLGNPYPREQAVPYKPVEWPQAQATNLPPPQNLPSTPFAAVVSARCSKRIFGEATREQLSALLWMSCRCQEAAESSLGIPIQRRPVPSAGAIHPIHIIVFGKTDDLLWRYDPKAHALNAIPVTESILCGLQQAVSTVLPAQQSMRILFVAEPGKTSAKYFNAGSLVWRDVGVLLGHMALVAEALQMSFCPLGITGEPWASQLDCDGKLTGVGMALAGALP